MPSIHLPISGSSGGLHRLNVDPVVPYGNSVRLSTVQNDPSGISQVTSVSFTHDHTVRSSIPFRCLMDAGISPAGLRQINISRRRVSTAISGRSSNRRRSREPDLPLLQPTCMESLKVLIRKLDHSECAAQLMTFTLKPSSIHLYENHWQSFVIYCQQKNLNIFSCYQAALWMVQSICLSVCLSVTPFSLCSHQCISTKFWGVITNDKSDIHAKNQDQRSKVKFTEVKTPLRRFRTVTPILIHIWSWNDV